MINPRTLFGRLGNELFRDAYIYAQVREGKIPDLYVQDPIYFEKYEAELKQRYGDGIGYLPYVSIHLRRGDYVGNPYYCQLWETGYYIDAVNLFPNRKFIIFSDDMEFAKRYFEGHKFAFDDSENEIDAFNRMASCSDHIIANSSFSFWAAYISPSISKKVVAPTYDKWYSDHNKTRTVIPKEWHQI